MSAYLVCRRFGEHQPGALLSWRWVGGWPISTESRRGGDVGDRRVSRERVFGVPDDLDTVAARDPAFGRTSRFGGFMEETCREKC